MACGPRTELKQLTAWNLNTRGNQKARVPDPSEVLKAQAEVCGGGGGGGVCRADHKRRL